MATPVETVRMKFLSLKPVMEERLTRLWAGAEAEALGDGGIAIVEEATGMSRTTIRTGRDELRAGVDPSQVVKVRRPGGGPAGVGPRWKRRRPRSFRRSNRSSTR